MNPNAIVTAFEKVCKAFLRDTSAYVMDDVCLFATRIDVVGYKDGKRVVIKTNSRELDKLRSFADVENLIVAQISDQVKDLYNCFE